MAVVTPRRVRIVVDASTQANEAPTTTTHVDHPGCAPEIVRLCCDSCVEYAMELLLDCKTHEDVLRLGYDGLVQRGLKPGHAFRLIDFANDTQPHAVPRCGEGVRLP
eukprot:Hpha_TRINITY_DN36337_c0_g1::TRINITY_DN36337_c0_g1_i1::g.86403::m.86403